MVIINNLIDSYEDGLKYYEFDKVEKLEGIDGALGWRRIVLKFEDFFKFLRPKIPYIVDQAIKNGADIKKDDYIKVTRSRDWILYKITWGPYERTVLDYLKESA